MLTPEPPFRVDIGDPGGQADGFRTGPQTSEVRVRVSQLRWPAMTDFGPQRGDEAHLLNAGGHDVRHDMRRGQLRQQFWLGMPAAQHSVSSGVVDHRPAGGHDPRAHRRQRHVGIHRGPVVEPEKSGLRRRYLFLFRQREEAARRAPEREMSGVSGADRGRQGRIAVQELLDHCFRESFCAAARTVTRHFPELVQ